MGWPSSLKTWVTGDPLNVTNLNTQLRDPLQAVGGVWQSYTPAITAATTNPTMGSSTFTGRYRLLGVAGSAGTVDIHMVLTIGAGWSSGSGNYQFSLPPGINGQSQAASDSRGTAMVRDVSVPAAKACVVYHFSPTTVSLVQCSNDTVVSASSPYTWASGDIISIHISAMEIA